MTTTRRHILGAIDQDNYYMRLLDNSGHLIALKGIQPEELPIPKGEKRWQTLKDRQENRYRQITLPLHPQGYPPWGYLQVGRSLKDFDDQLTQLRWILGLGLPVTMGVIAISSWWLAGLAMRPIRQSYQQMQQFTADAAHELRTPLAVLQAAIESTPASAVLPALEVREPQRIVERQINRLSQLVNDLLLLCRMDQQVLPVQKQPCCLNDLICDLVEEFEDLASAARVNLTRDLKVCQPLFVRGDLEQLYRLVSNLIINAIQHTPDGGQVTVVLDRSQDDALIQVQDTGIGIALPEQTRVFERFYRVSSDRSRNTGGSGLGLAISQAIVQSHHGSLQLKSESGKGSIFTIRLPL